MTNLDKNLVERFREGDRTAFDQLYDRMSRRIYRFALRLTGSHEDAEDVTVQTFTQAYLGRERFREESSVETWMYRITVHMAHRVKRKRRDQPTVDEGFADHVAARELEAIELEELISGLPEGLRIAFLLVKGEGLSYREAADVLSRPTGTVQAQVHRASASLRSKLSSEAIAVPCESLEQLGYEV